MQCKLSSVYFCYKDNNNPNDYCNFISECPQHCSLCYNETNCYECTQGYYLDFNEECSRKCFKSSVSLN